MCHNSQFGGLMLSNNAEFNESNNDINFTESSGLEVETEAGEVNDSFQNTITIDIELHNQAVMTGGNAQRKRKQHALFQIDAKLENLGKEQRQDMLSSSLSRTEKYTIAHAYVSSTYEGVVVNLLIEYLTRLKRENGFYDLKCCAGNCDECRAFPFPELPKLDTTQVNYYTYEVTKTPYVDKKEYQR